MTPAGESGTKDFKDRISPEAIAALGLVLKGAWSDFPEAQFVGSATAGLADLELKARVAHVADALVSTMPRDFEAAARVIWKAMESPAFDGWIVYCVDDWVALAGLEDPIRHCRFSAS